METSIRFKFISICVSYIWNLVIEVQREIRSRPFHPLIITMGLVLGAAHYKGYPEHVWWSVSLGLIIGLEIMPHLVKFLGRNPRTSRLTESNWLDAITELLIEAWSHPRPEIHWFKQSISLVLFLGAFSWISGHSLQLALMLVFFKILHEIGHAAMYLRFGVQPQMLFLFPLGALVRPANPTALAKAQTLPFNQKAWVIQAGPLINAVGLMAGYILTQLPLNSGWHSIGQDLIVANGVLMLMNLVPLGMHDGGEIIFLIFSSLKETWDRLVALVAMTLSLGLILVIVCAADENLNLVGLIINLLNDLGWVLFLYAFFYGIWHLQGVDDPADAVSPRAMTAVQIGVHLAVYLITVTFTLWVIVGPPSLLG